jgi:membrane glycosyltransferase
MNGNDIAIQRWLMLGLVFSTTAAATARLFAVFRVDGVSPLEMAVLVIFAVLFSWIAASFWIGCIGVHALWRGANDRCLRTPVGVEPSTDARGSRTVLIVPIHNEDSTDAKCRAEEVDEWHRLHCSDENARVFYRSRSDNTEHKSGNIADFCRNWGALYEYMVVLDADSLMTGRTLVSLVGLMDANPRAALIQAPPLLIGGETLFARSQQFASWLYGRVYAAGLSRLQGADGNYWGHNAIIRTRPFMENCGLPRLPGRPPLGGEILSHDFVEAALLRRAGWDVWLATEIGGSYEATPPTILDHLKRDRRWCQGNLQHVKLLLAQGLRLPNRIHFLFGAMSYLASPLWLVLVVLFSLNAVALEDAAPVTYVGRYPVLSWPISHTVAFVSIAIAAMAMLYVPRFLSLLLVLRDRRSLREFGGARRVVLSVLVESVLSTLLAPIFMLQHSWFVFNILIGRSTRWGAQPRGSQGIGWGAAARAFAPHTLIGVAAGMLAWYWTPACFWWYLPLLAGLATAIGLVWLTSDPAWGAAVRRHGLFLVPSETTVIPVVGRVDALLAGPDMIDRTAQADMHAGAGPVSEAAQTA